MNRSLIALCTFCTLMLGCGSSDGVGLEQDTQAPPSQDAETDPGDASTGEAALSDATNATTQDAPSEDDSVAPTLDTGAETVDSESETFDVITPSEDSVGEGEDVAGDDEDTSSPPEDIGTEPEDGSSTPEDGTAVPPTPDAIEGDVTGESDADEGAVSDVGDDAAIEDTLDTEDVSADDIDADVTEDVDEGPTWLELCPGSIAITGPATESFHLIGGPFIASATVTGPASMDGLTVRWETTSGESLGQTPVLPDGTSSGNLDTALMPLGVIPLVARLETPDGLCSETTEVDLVFCQYEVSDDFSSLDEVTWKMFGSSYWDANGWLEMTGTGQGQRGAVYNPQTDVAAGSVSITFSMATGGGSGADGFAMTIVQTDSIAELEEEIIANAVPGSGLGYAVGGPYGSWDGNAFTVEIDTYHNVYNGTNELHTDPTPNDHAAITLDGDSGNHLWWTDMGEVEDLSWRTIRVDVIGFKVRVWIDNQLLVEQVYPELQFRGGYIFFSGSTGYYTNYHRFDDLNVIHTCQ